MSLEREEKHLPVLIAICFAGNFILGGIGQAFSMGSFGQLFSWQWGSLLFMAGTSLYAAKLHTDKWHISSAGFILLSIAQGIIYTMQNSTFSKEGESMYAAGIMVFFPGMLMLCYYSGFPVWLRIFGLLATLPFLVIMAKIDMKDYDVHKDMWFNIAGFIMLQLTGICWSYFALRPYKKITVQH
ncbi:MAG TPA: hypothetical protein VE978_08340 [Chitinophagales bacterium]|nr:hypothetical protein [Chitinophagales bacterium]